MPESPDRLAASLPHPRRLLELGPHDGAHRAALRAGAAVALPLLTLWLVGRTDLALYTTFGAFASLYGRRLSHVPRAKLQLTVAACLIGAVGIGALVATSPERLWLVVPVTAAYAGAVTLVSNACRWLPAGSLFPVFALSATASIPGDGRDAALATALAAGSALLALAIGLAGLVRPRARTRAPSTWGIDVVRAPRRRRTWEDVARTSAAVLLAGLAPTALGFDYPYWSMVAAAAAVSGVDAASRFVRAGHRLIGTLIGVGITAVILHTGPPAIVTIGLICVLQVCAELFVVRNYGLALVFVTPLALLMIALSHAQPATSLLWPRIVETAIGVAVVIALTLGEHLRSQHRSRSQHREQRQDREQGQHRSR